jgi:hypothetical protein
MPDCFLTSGRWSCPIFPLFLLSASNLLGFCTTPAERGSEKWKENLDKLGTWDPGSDTWVSFRIYFLLIDSTFEAEETNNLEMPTREDGKKVPTEV